MKKSTLICVTMFLALNIMGQKKNIAFNEMVHNFGTIEMAEGEVTTRFEFTNNGEIPLYITSVRPACGCTSSKFSHDSVFFEDKGFVEATFNPRGRTGPFDKVIDVNTNLGLFILHIKGNVSTEKQEKEGLSYGILSLNKLKINMGKQFHDAVYLDTIIVYNHTKYPHYIRRIQLPSSHVEVNRASDTIPANSSMKLFVKIKVDGIGGFGKGVAAMHLYTSDLKQPRKTIFIDYEKVERFPKHTRKYLKNAPKMVVDAMVQDFGEIKRGGQGQRNIKITNEGKDTLIIRRLKVSCSCVNAVPDKMEILPGETIEIKTYYDTVLRNKGEQKKYLTIITNDPLKSVVTIKLQVNIL
jgi:hypothetical protein